MSRFEHRYGSFGIVLALGAVLALCVGLILFVVDTRHTAHDSQKIAAVAAKSEQDLRETILRRCQDRQKYDQRFVRGAEGDLAFYRDLLSLAEEAEGVRTTPLSPEQTKIINDQKKLLRDAADRKAAIVAEGVIGSCQDYVRP